MKKTMPTEIEATYRVVTPMFCGGAGAGSAELRLPSFKGVLRFWWRASAWSRLHGDLGKIQQEEDALFGSTASGQSPLSMRLAPCSVPPMVRKGAVLAPSRTDGGAVGEGARYLGYGVMEAFASRTKGTRAGELTRACLRAPIDFTVRMRLRGRGAGRDEFGQRSASLEDALVCLGTQGGMGAKSRKGYGSLVIRSLLVNGEQRWRRPQTMHDLRDALATLRRDHDAADQPAYTALSTQARHVLLSSDRTQPMELLDLLGRELMRYRSLGHRGRVLGQESEKKFRDDHDLMHGNRRSRHPRRIAFGLPHNYGKRPDKQVGPHDREIDRRASPLFIHIHECGDTPIAVLSFLPARFLPEGRSDISVGGSRVRQTPEAELYRPIQRIPEPPSRPREAEGRIHRGRGGRRIVTTRPRHLDRPRAGLRLTVTPHPRSVGQLLPVGVPVRARDARGREGGWQDRSARCRR